MKAPSKINYELLYRQANELVEQAKKYTVEEKEPDAIGYYEQAAAIYKQLEDWEEYITCLIPTYTYYISKCIKGPG